MLVQDLSVLSSSQASSCSEIFFKKFGFNLETSYMARLYYFIAFLLAVVVWFFIVMWKKIL